MKKIILAVTLMLSGFAFAGGNNSPTPNCPTGCAVPAGASSVGTQEQQQTSTSEAQASTDGNVQNIQFNTTAPTNTKQTVEYEGTYKLKNVPNVGAPPLTTSNDTCMGSTTAGVAVAGFGISFGSTWTDANCVMLKNGREMWNMGMRAAAIARMCMDEKNKESLEITGTKCPQTEAKEKAEAERLAAKEAAKAAKAAKK